MGGMDFYFLAFKGYNAQIGEHYYKEITSLVEITLQM